MVGSLYHGISGVVTHQYGIDNTSNNIANINTNGYRANMMEFHSLFSRPMDFVNANSPISNDYNYGVTVGANAINANDGTYVSSEGQFNVAYSGRGWFTVGLNSGGSWDVLNPNYTNDQVIAFTRDGSFSRDSEGFLVNTSGYYMYGINLGKIAADGQFTASNSLEADYAGLAGSNLEPIRIPANLFYQPTITTQVNIAMNLNRTQNFKGIGDGLLDDRGEFSMEKFWNQDINTFGTNNVNNKNGTSGIDAKNYRDINFSINRNGTTENYSFIYGQDFTAFGELSDLIFQNTGLTLNLKLDSNGNPADCTLNLANFGMDDVKLSISGKLAEKLGLKANGNDLKTAMNSRLKEYNPDWTYESEELVLLNGVIFKKLTDNAPAEDEDPFTDTANWEIFDTGRVAKYDAQKAEEYKEGDVINYEGKIYRRSAEELEKEVDEDGNETILAPNENAGWEEVSDNVKGSIETYQQGKDYKKDSIVLQNGYIYQKVGDGNTDPSFSSPDWKIVVNGGLSTNALGVPTYQTNTEIYNESGDKFLLKNEFVLIQQPDNTQNPPALERWEVQSAIWDKDGNVMISDAKTITEITFNPDGTPNITPFNMPFLQGNLQVDLGNSGDGKVSSNFAYADSSLKGESQDGAAAGNLKDITINDDGVIFVHFSNNRMEPIGRFGLATFVNDQGLKKMGANMFSMAPQIQDGQVYVASGAPILSWEDGGLAGLKYGTIMDHMLEMSNTNTTTALTDLIIYQRGYQMNAKAITTSDQLMQEAIGLKRS